MSIDSDIDDLIDGVEPKGEEIFISPYNNDKMAAEAGISLSFKDVTAGVSIHWLATVFGMSHDSVAAKLRKLPWLKRQRNTAIYSLKQAVAYLIEPKMDMAELVKTLKPSDIPAKFQKDYWAGLRERQKWELEAKELWETEDVLELLGDVFTHMKSSTQLWAEEVERETKLSIEQRRILRGLSDGLLDQIHRKLVEIPKQRRTPSVAEKRAELPEDHA